MTDKPECTCGEIYEECAKAAERYADQNVGLQTERKRWDTWQVENQIRIVARAIAEDIRAIPSGVDLWKKKVEPNAGGKTQEGEE